MRALLIAVLAASLFSACSVASAPDGHFRFDYTFAGYTTEAKTGFFEVDTKPTALALSYDWPIGAGVSIAAGVMTRTDDPDGVGSTLGSKSVLLKILQHYQLIEGLGGWFGTVGGYIFDMEGASTADYDTSFLYGFEAGARAPISGGIGVQAGAQWLWYEAQGKGFTPDTDLSGISFFGGVYVDF